MTHVPLLALDTATARVAVCVMVDGSPLVSTQVTRGRHHAELLVPMIQDACARAGVSLGEVGAVGVDVGPGLFTGLRVGIATAQGLAGALGVPAVGVHSLDVVARPMLSALGRAVGAQACPLVVPVLDARRGEVYASVLDGELADDGEVVPRRLRPPWVGPPESLAAALAGLARPAVLVGDGALRYRDVLADGCGDLSWADDDLALPTPSALGRCCVAALARGEGGPPAGLRPLYLRAPDAEINWITRDSA